jgi:hypothetical protein
MELLCLMPDHVHLILTPKMPEGLGRQSARPIGGIPSSSTRVTA